MLTRNIYREDECIAALKWSIMRGKQEESIFWAEECIYSSMHGELLEALLWGWCFSCGPSALPWIELLRERMERGITEEDMYELTYILLEYRRACPDSSAFVLLSLGLSAKGEQTEAPDYLVANGPAVLERAIQQGKTELAWYLARPLWDTLSWPKFSILHTISSWFSVWDEEMTWPIRAVILAAACSKRPAVDVKYSVPEWELKEIPMRRRRQYAIPAECLTLFTKRGDMSVSETTDTDLTHHLEENLHGSRFWDEYISSLHGTDIQREEFYDTFFPNDIPDEWSREDREKSHGRGVAASTLSECLERWFQDIPCRSIWKGLSAALGVWKGVSVAPFMKIFHVPYTEKMGLWKERMKTWEFPVCRRVLEPGT